QQQDLWSLGMTLWELITGWDLIAYWAYVFKSSIEGQDLFNSEPYEKLLYLKEPYVEKLTEFKIEHERFFKYYNFQDQAQLYGFFTFPKDEDERSQLFGNAKIAREVGNQLSRMEY